MRAQSFLADVYVKINIFYILLFSRLGFSLSLSPSLSQHMLHLIIRRCTSRRLDIILIASIRFVFHEIVKQTGPRFGVVVRRDVARLGEIQEHVPRVLRNATNVGMLFEEVQPPVEYVGRVNGENETPQDDGHVERHDAIARVEAKHEGEAIELLEHFVVGAQSIGDLLQAPPNADDRVGAHRLEALNEFGLGEATHLRGVQAPGEHQNCKVVRFVAEIGAKAFDALGEDGVLLRVFVLFEESVQCIVGHLWVLFG